MIYEIKGNLLNADEAFIAHQVNGKGVVYQTQMVYIRVNRAVQ